MTFDSFIGLCAAGAIAFLFYTSRPFTPPPSITGLVAVAQTTSHLTTWSDSTDATDLIDVVDDVTGDPIAHYVRGRDGVLRIAKDQPDIPAGGHKVRLSDTPVLSLGARAGSLGAFAGFFAGDLRSGHRAQIGLHYEPFTFLADTVHLPSVALSTDLVGIGLTVNLPPHRFPLLSHFGVGVWEAAPFDGSHPGLLYGAELHTPLP